MSDYQSPHGARRARLEPLRVGAVMRSSALWMYAGLAVFLLALAAWMATLGQRELTSMYVAAPAIGALWFALRVFMMLGRKP